MAIVKNGKSIFYILTFDFMSKVHYILYFTDKECSMYTLSMSEARAIQASTSAPEEEEPKPDVPTLMQQMRDTGLVMKPGALPLAATRIEEDEPSTLTETDLLSQLTKKQKKKLLK